MYLVFRIHVKTQQRTPMGPVVSTIEKACAKARKLQAAEKDPVFRYLVFGPHQPNASSSRRRQKGYRWFLPDQADAQSPSSTLGTLDRTPTDGSTDLKRTLRPTSPPVRPSATAKQDHSPTTGGVNVTTGHRGVTPEASPPRSHSRTSRSGNSRYVVHRFVNGVSTTQLGTYGSLMDAYIRAHSLHEADARPRIDFRIHGPAPEPEVYRRLSRARYPIPVTGVWYVLDSSPAEPPAIRAKEVLRLLGYIAGAATSPKPAESDNTLRRFHTGQSPNLAAKRRPPKAPTLSRRHDWEFEDRPGDISLIHREPEEMGIGIPAQRGKGRRSRKGWYIP